MLRRPLHHQPTGEYAFRWRGGEISRVEGFTDAVFAFALTLLVVALEVPRSFHDLTATMSGFLAFAACFAIFAWIWYEHYAFFRKYGVHDAVTIALNFVLIFVVLFYVYPLKFMFTVLSLLIFGVGGAHPPELEGEHQVVSLMIVYGIGFVAVFIVFALLHLRALHLADQLELTPVERFDTRAWVRAHLLSASVGVASIAVAALVPPRAIGVAGMLYGVLGPLHAFYGRRHGRRRRRFVEALREESVQADSVA